jgi:hypothetical protein
MQPPPRRVQRIDLRSPTVLRTLILNATAGVMTVLIIRLGSLMVHTGDAAFPRYAQHASRPFVWPFKQLPLLDTAVGRGVLIADLLVIPVFFIIGLLIAGILAGWQETSATNRHLSR